MPVSAFTEQQQQFLLVLARASIASRFDNSEIDTALLLASREPPFDQTGASFVTLKIDRQLRGCIGTLEAHRSLGEDIIHNARAAAFSDPRFAPLESAELPRVHLHISILTEPQALQPMTEAQLLDALQPGVDGLVLHEGSHRATFLPSVWESLTSAKTFLQELKRKAGLPPEYWSDTLRFERYRVTEFTET